MDQPSHKLTLSDRETLSMTGVEEVVSFDEAEIILHTVLGTLTVQGSRLHLKELSLDGGQIQVDGTVSALIYQEQRQPGGWFSRLLQ